MEAVNSPSRTGDQDPERAHLQRNERRFTSARLDNINDYDTTSCLNKGGDDRRAPSHTEDEEESRFDKSTSTRLDDLESYRRHESNNAANAEHYYYREEGGSGGGASARLLDVEQAELPRTQQGEGVPAQTSKNFGARIEQIESLVTALSGDVKRSAEGGGSSGDKLFAKIDNLETITASESAKRHEAECMAHDLAAELGTVQDRLKSEVAARASAESNAKQYMALFTEARAAWLHTQGIVATKERALAAAEEKLTPEVEISSIQARLEKAKETKQQEREQAQALQLALEGCLATTAATPKDKHHARTKSNSSNKKNARKNAEERVAGALESLSLAHREGDCHGSPRGAAKVLPATPSATRQQQKNTKPSPLAPSTAKVHFFASSPALNLPRHASKATDDFQERERDLAGPETAAEGVLASRDVNLSPMSPATPVSEGPPQEEKNNAIDTTKYHGGGGKEEQEKITIRKAREFLEILESPGYRERMVTLEGVDFGLAVRFADEDDFLRLHETKVRLASRPLCYQLS